MSTHIVVSHGSDFFGEDHLPVRRLRELGEHLRGVLPACDHPPLTQLLETAGTAEHTISGEQAALLAVLLRRAAASKHLSKPHAAIAARLGCAAANAASSPDPWTWRTSAGS
ncbi:hypothetical protein [Streptomyces sp. Ac-502]|uniref:DUF7739 domain-containing protein n=1 Tax=Streptomyces sp. Ac-502 TaxID=3342801 RepID=UPI00386237CA